MKDGKIKIAVWNIFGPTHGEKSPASAGKIKSFQEEVKPDVAFYLEAPDKDTPPIPEEEVNKNWDRAFCFWSRSEKDNPRGILAVKYKEGNEKLSIKEIELTGDDPKDKKGRTALGINLEFCGKEFLRILCVWTTPDTASKSQSVYFNTLSDILKKYKDHSDFFDDQKILRIVVGDTNVNLSAGAEKEEEVKETDYCKTFRSRIAALSSELQLCDTGLLENTLLKGNLYYRCDLLMSTDNKRILSPSLGEFGYEDGFKSDHRPIIFEISVPSV